MNTAKRLLAILLCISAVIASSLIVGASTNSILDPEEPVSITISDLDLSEEFVDDRSLTGSMITYPTDIQLVQQGERSFLHKTYSVSAEYDVNQLIEKPFVQAGYRYTFSEIIHREYIAGGVSKIVSEEKTIEITENQKEDILSNYELAIPYTDTEGYEGVLQIDENNVIISEKEKTPFSYTISESKLYLGLPSNDTASIPKSIEKNGMTLQLDNVSWEVTGSEHYGYSDIPKSYTATAYYTALATGSKASRFLSKANYVGEVHKETPGKSVYTIVYEGEKVIAPFNMKPLIVLLSIIILLGTVIILIRKLRKNVTIYTIQDGVPVLYEKQRIDPKNPVLYLNHIGNTGIRLVFDKSYLKKSLDQTIFIIGKHENYRFELDSRLIYDLTSGTDKGEKGMNFDER